MIIDRREMRARIVSLLRMMTGQPLPAVSEAVAEA
jgi:hypothetical protein